MAHLSRLLGTVLSFTLAALLSGCAAPGRDEVVLPKQRAWVEGHLVEYVTTDISDAAMAAQAGVNHVPRLSDAVGSGRSSITERVYKFADATQISIFASGPGIVGRASPDSSYSPLWRLVLVRWTAGTPPRELRSEEALLAAEDKGEVTLDVTTIVVNCPITRGVEGSALRGVR